MIIASLLGSLALGSGLPHPLHENLGDGVSPVTLAPSHPSDENAWILPEEGPKSGLSPV